MTIPLRTSGIFISSPRPAEWDASGFSTGIYYGRMMAGAHSADWNAGKFPGGGYIYRLRVGSYTGFEKMVLLK